MEALVAALKRAEREQAAKHEETQDDFRAKFAALYGPNRPHPSRSGAEGANRDPGTEQAGTPSTDRQTNAGPIQGEFEGLPPPSGGRFPDQWGENDPGTGENRLPDDGEVPETPGNIENPPADESAEAGTDNDTTRKRKAHKAGKRATTGAGGKKRVKKH